MAWTVEDMPDLAGKRAVVTGANSGIGFPTALHLARAGAEVILAVRSPERGAAAAARIVSAHPDATVRVEPLDLDRLASVRAFADRIGTAHDRLDILVNNAGLMMLPKRETTADGFERQLGVNFLGHFALTALLLPLLKASVAPRTVQLSSLAHRGGRIRLDDLQSERSYKPWRAYAQSKLAMLMFALELGRRAEAAGWKLVSTAAHPGWARSNLIATGFGATPAGLISRAIWPVIAQSAESGALPPLYAASANGIAQGGYYGPRLLSETRGPPGPAGIGPQARDQEAAARLWEEAERLTGVTFSF